MTLLTRIFIIIVFLATLIIVVTFARGYRIDFSKKNLTSTGIIAISSTPKAAKVFVNGELKGVTDLNLTLAPGEYNVEIKKEGYTDWKKNVKLKGELVLSLDGLLFPLNSSLSPLTNLGLVKAISVPQSENIILISETGDALKDGVYLFDLRNNPLSFLQSLKPILLKKNLISNLGEIELKTSSFFISPDGKQTIIDIKNQFGSNLAYLLDLDKENKTLFDVTNSKETLIEAWKQESEQIDRKILEAYPKNIAKVATDSFHIISFSPDETKILYQAKNRTTIPNAIKPPLIATNQTIEEREIIKNNIYVYDRKEDKNYKITNFQYPISNLITWYSDSRHLVLNEGKKISVIEYDDQNKQIVYSSPYDSSFFKISSDGKIIVLTNLNPEVNKYSDLYAVGIK